MCAVQICRKRVRMKCANLQLTLIAMTSLVSWQKLSIKEEDSCKTHAAQCAVMTFVISDFDFRITIQFISSVCIYALKYAYKGIPSITTQSRCQSVLLYFFNNIPSHSNNAVPSSSVSRPHRSEIVPLRLICTHLGNAFQWTICQSNGSR